MMQAQRIQLPARGTVKVQALFKSTVTKAKAPKETAEKKFESKGMTQVVDALDFARPTARDAETLYKAKTNWKKGESKLSPEEYAALARKIRGSYKDYFKDYVVEERVEATWTKEGSSAGTVPFLGVLVGIVFLMLVATVVVVGQTSV
mmetsp:Transcript_2515/g.6464  ORF Transcript_2515/g.6464 Transcript_2515/m.6464 type:complete len:148 (-) Transcript_2515:538-981(-)|eukprot:CAMPEP_0202863410 /NCGR_PEP_ID=MMETSP1391-20130828/4063_1 /ASSEMBLY_ACC=CAM_ASM_000867 /TAXON_ID=1034604 /ORGANISM="Chlamydomonas leiostraca, Strain SAG 11-49" /LENGTH=147 /DNA_ID=CAMNT_0049543047 /DNA_START=73 /DNA_END=516 /DNA_ORIENTATION=-